MKNVPLLFATLVGTVLLIIGVAMMFSQPAEQKEVDQAKLIGDAKYAIGSATAQVTIVEFSDFQCPACRAVQPLVKQVVDKYPDKVRLVFRHFPLMQIHQHALLAAQATAVAAEQGKFWEMHDKLFETQPDWAELASNDEAKARFAEYAVELGIDKAAFLERIDSEAIKQAVASDIAVGNEIKIQATPTLFVNGRQVSAPQQLFTTVESLLK